MRPLACWICLLLTTVVACGERQAPEPAAPARSPAAAGSNAAAIEAPRDLEASLRAALAGPLTGIVAVGALARLHPDPEGARAAPASGRAHWLREGARAARSMRILEDRGDVIMVETLAMPRCGGEPAWSIVRGFVARDALMPVNGTDAVLRHPDGTGAVIRAGTVLHREGEQLYVQVFSHPEVRIPVALSQLAFSVPEDQPMTSLATGDLRDLRVDLDREADQRCAQVWSERGECQERARREAGAGLSRGGFAARLGDVVVQEGCPELAECVPSGPLILEPFERERGRWDGESTLLVFGSACREVVVRSDVLPLRPSAGGSGALGLPRQVPCLVAPAGAALYWGDGREAGRLAASIQLTDRSLEGAYACSNRLLGSLVAAPLCLRSADLRGGARCRSYDVRRW